MYKTHVEVGKNFYWLSLPVMVKMGVIPNAVKMSAEGASGVEIGVAGVVAAAYMYLGYQGVIFGAGFPDLDLEGTVPDRKNPVLGKIIRACGATHRGGFSHSFDSITIFFGIVYTLVRNIIPGFLLGFMGGMPGWVKGQFMVGGLINSAFLVYIAFAYIGALSHLIADLPTGGGVRVFFWGKQFRLRSKFFRTGEDSLWEMLCRKSAKVLQPLSIGVSIAAMFLGL